MGATGHSSRLTHKYRSAGVASVPHRSADSRPRTQTHTQSRVSGPSRSSEVNLLEGRRDTTDGTDKLLSRLPRVACRAVDDVSTRLRHDVFSWLEARDTLVVAHGEGGRRLARSRRRRRMLLLFVTVRAPSQFVPVAVGSVRARYLLERADADAAGTAMLLA